MVIIGKAMLLCVMLFLGITLQHGFVERFEKKENIGIPNKYRNCFLISMALSSCIVYQKGTQLSWSMLILIATMTSYIVVCGWILYHSFRWYFVASPDVNGRYVFITRYGSRI